MTEIHLVLRYDPDMAPDFDGDLQDLEVVVFEAIENSSIATNLLEVEVRGVDTDDWPLQ